MLFAGDLAKRFTGTIRQEITTHADGPDDAPTLTVQALSEYIFA